MPALTCSSGQVKRCGNAELLIIATSHHMACSRVSLHVVQCRQRDKSISATWSRLKAACKVSPADCAPAGFTKRSQNCTGQDRPREHDLL